MLKQKALFLIFIALLSGTLCRSQVVTAEELGLSTDGLTTGNVQKLKDAVDVGYTINSIQYPPAKTIVFTNKSVANAQYLIDENISDIKFKGVTFRFEAGSRLVGNNTINHVTIESSPLHWIFDMNLKFGSIKTPDGVFSVKWFGAKGDRTTDDYPAIQKSIDVAKNRISRLFLPRGFYKISKPLIIIADGAGINVSLEVYGESNLWTDENTEIHADFNHAFAIGVQRGKGVKISKLWIHGQYIPPSWKNDEFNFFNREFTTGFPDMNTQTAEPARDRRQSPYSGIVFDPFTNINSPTPPASPNDDYYSGLDNDELDDWNQYYNRLTNPDFTTSGSSGCSVEDVALTNFVVGIISAPNPVTQNEEMLKISRVYIQYCKLAISGGQDQEKMNVVDNLTAWNNIHTVFATGVYGRPNTHCTCAGNWIITNVNIAGGVVRFIYNPQSGAFPSFISNVYAEKLGRFGVISGESLSVFTNGSQVSDCNFNFEGPEKAGLQVLVGTKIIGEPEILTGRGVSFKNCSFRYYDSQRPTMMLLSTRANFEDCKFSGVPVQHGQFSHARLNTGNYTNCSADRSKFGFDIRKYSSKSFETGEYLRKNKLSLTDNQIYREGANNKRLTETYNFEGGDVFIPFYPEQGENKTEVTVQTNRSLMLPADPQYFYSGAVVAFSNAKPGELMSSPPVGYGIVDYYQPIELFNSLIPNDPLETHLWYNGLSPIMPNGITFTSPGNTNIYFAGMNPNSPPTQPTPTSLIFTAPTGTTTTFGFRLTFEQSAYFTTAGFQSIEGSIDGGTTWISLRTPEITTNPPSNLFTRQTVSFPPQFNYAPSIQIKFTFRPNSASYWAVTNIKLEGQGFPGGDIRVIALSKEIPVGSGEYFFSCLYPAKNTGSFIGDITGPNTISNVVLDFADTWSFNGALIKTAYSSAKNGWVKVRNFNTVTRTMTTLGNEGKPFSVQENGLYFHNGATKTATTTSSAGENLQTATNRNMIFYKGMKISELDNSDKQKVTTVCKTGFLPSAVPSGETRIAEFCPPEDAVHWNVTGNEIEVVNDVPQNLFGTITNHDVRLITNNQERGVIKYDGRFGIGTMDPQNTLHVEGDARIRILPPNIGGNNVVFANGDGELKSLTTTGLPNHYLSGAGNWQTLPTIPQSGVYKAEQGLTLDEESGNETVVLGDWCAKGGGEFQRNREINMNNHNLYFNSSEQGRVYIGIPEHEQVDECMEIAARLTLGSEGLPEAVNEDLIGPPSTSGLRFQNLTSKDEPFEPLETKGVLSLDADGDVIWIKTPCCEQQKSSTNNEILQRLNKLEGELKAMRIENNKLRNMISTKFNSNFVRQIAATIFSILSGQMGLPGKIK